MRPRRRPLLMVLARASRDGAMAVAKGMNKSVRSKEKKQEAHTDAAKGSREQLLGVKGKKMRKQD